MAISNSRHISSLRLLRFQAESEPIVTTEQMPQLRCGDCCYYDGRVMPQLRCGDCCYYDGRVMPQLRCGDRCPRSVLFQ